MSPPAYPYPRWATDSQRYIMARAALEDVDAVPMPGTDLCFFPALTASTWDGIWDYEVVE